MRLLFHRREVPVLTRGDREVSALVRVRGIDGRKRGSGVFAARYDPEAVVVRANGTVSRIALPQREPLPASAAFIAAPAIYAALRIMFARRRRR